MAHGVFGLIHRAPAIAAAATLLAMVLCVSCGARTAGDAPRTEKVTIEGETFNLELAIDDASRSKGLGGRTAIPDAGGMLFVFPDAQVRRFWMLDCTIDIDIMFLDPLGIVTAVHRMTADPQRPGESREAYEARLRMYSSLARSQFAIELKAGSIDRLGVKTGDKIELDRRRLKSITR